MESSLVEGSSSQGLGKNSIASPFAATRTPHENPTLEDNEINRTTNNSGNMEEEEEESYHFESKKRKTTSKVWNEFTKIKLPDGRQKAESHYCKSKLSWEHTSQASIKIDCVKVYEIEKKKLNNYLKVFQDWNIENKVFTISVDNASNNDKAIKNLTETFSRLKKLPCRDPRSKMIVAKFTCPRMCSGDELKANIKTVRDALSELYKEYVRHIWLPKQLKSYFMGEIGVEVFMDLKERTRKRRCQSRSSFPLLEQEHMGLRGLMDDLWDKIDECVEIVVLFIAMRSGLQFLSVQYVWCSISNGLRVPIESFAYKEYGIRLMLAPRRMIPDPSDVNREITVTETFHVQTDDELTDKELKQIEVDDQAIQTILLGLPEDIYVAVDSCETAQKIWLRVQQMMKGSDIGIQEKKAKLFNEWERFTSNEGESIESYYHRFLKLMNDLKRNKHFPEKISSNLKFLNNLQPEWSRHVTIVHQTKDLHTADYTQLYDFLKYNQKEVDELKAERLAKTQDPLALMENSNNPYVFLAPHQDQSSFNQNYLQQPMPNPEDITNPLTAMNMVTQNPRVQNIGNQNGVIVVPGNGNQNGNGNLVAARAKGNAAGQNGNQIRCYNCRGIEEYDLMAAAADLDEIEKVNANCILMANLQQASTSGTQTDSAPVYDSDGSPEVHEYENCYDNEIFNMFTQEEQYTELLEPILESHQVPQNDNDIISEEAAKFVGDFKFLAKEADESLTKHKALELEIERLLKAVISQDIISVVQNESVVDTSVL
nr:zinc finger BED domain-containing protein RICESLEEPER 2 [Tanacetum cinerariifolium]